MKNQTIRVDIFKRQPTIHRKVNGISETIPDQSLSLRTILDRHTRGIPMETKITQYNETENGDAILENYDNLDLVDKQEIRDRVVRELDEIGQRVKETRLNAKKKALKDELRIELEAELVKKQTEQQQPPN